MHTETSTTPAVQSTVTCPDCWGNGEFVTGSYSRTCATCWGEGIVAVEVDDEGDEPTPPAPVPTATIIAEASPADNAAGRYGAAAKSSGPGGFDRAMLAACESLARQLGATPTGREMAASIGRAGRQAGTPQEFADLAADNPFADAAYIEATAYDAQGGL